MGNKTFRCIYCLLEKSESEFNQEHVIPQAFGTCDEMILENIVCSTCNSAISNYENIAKEQSAEGIHATLFRFNEPASVQIRTGTKLQISTNSDTVIFSDYLPKLDPEKQLILPDSSITIRKKGSSNMRIFFLDQLFDLNKKQNSEFRKKKDEIALLQPSDISIYTDQAHGWTIEKAIELMKVFGITNYNEKSREEFPKPTKNKLEIEIKIDVESLYRVIAKTAFEFFAFCSQKVGHTGQLFSKEFDTIRKYVICPNTRDTPKDIVQTITTPILSDTKYKPIANILTFDRKDSTIVSKISILGLSTYGVIIGKYPFKFEVPDTVEFGCGVIVNPFSRQVYELCKDNIPNLSHQKYHLFK